MAPLPSLDRRAHALFLDFDGTLVGFRDDPASVRLDPAELGVLIRLHRALSGALAIVSGRRIADLDRLLSPLAVAAAGVHGLERRDEPGAAIVELAGPRALDGLRLALAAGLASAPGLELEDKGAALVLHYRKAPALGAFAKRLMAGAVAGREEFSVMHGQDIVEVHVAGMDKGKAVAILSKVPPFIGRVPVYVGDDTTDEFALGVVRAAGGVSIKVGGGETVAEHRLPDVAAVHRWLGAALKPAQVEGSLE